MAASTTPPVKIMIVRHGEKPPKNGGPPFDITQEGQPGNGKSLIVPGWQRAGALCSFFAPAKASHANPHLARPDFIYTADPDKGGSQRPFETVLPLATWLGYKKGSPQFNASLEIGKDEKTLAEDVLALSGTVLISWEHLNIMPNLMGHINHHVPISNFSSIPNPFPDVFYLVWILDLDTSANTPGYTWSSIDQCLVPGDPQS